MTRRYYYINHVSNELDICGHLRFQNKQQISISLFPLWKQCILEKQKFLPVLFKIALIKNACQVLFISLECLMETKKKNTNEDTYDSGFTLEIVWQVSFFL